MTQRVPFGYEPPADQPKGTLIYYDSFEQTLDEELDVAAHTARVRSFERFILYPLHEETMKRMSKSTISPFHKREKRLYDWKEERGLEKEEIYANRGCGSSSDGNPACPPFLIHLSGEREFVRIVLLL
jgi:hypothetical protein